MEEIVKHINDTNASFRTLGAGDAKNTDLFLDNEHYELFRDAGEHITVRFNKENLQKAILFIASILPRKYDNSSIHKVEPFSSAFVFDQLALLDAFFTIDGNAVEIRTQSWNARKNVEKKNGEIDNRFYFNGLLEEVSYKDYRGIDKSAKFTIRNYLAGGYSDLHIKKADDGVFDIWITNALEPKDDGKEKTCEIIVPHLITEPKQIIYYGTPGSGKSHKVKEITNTIDKNYVYRTTFHPDTDYASFVGCYKPKGNRTHKTDYTKQQLIEILTNMKDSGLSYPMHRFAVEYYFALEPLTRAEREEITLAAGFTAAYLVEMDKSIAAGKHIKHIEKENSISYKFSPQVFTNAYIKAWEDTRKPVYLIIEEINRGNCAQIFGDLFQLLDRDKKTGISEYSIKADNDLADYLEKALGVDHEGIKNRELRFPSNLIIYATMNTSDQSLFPMDSAFKRRWDWEYVPIDYETGDSATYTITIDNETYKWVEFLKVVNDKIRNLTHSEDKQMGNYFIKKSINQDEFINKVMFYLWDEVCKEEYKTDRNFLRYRENPDAAEIEFSFTDLFGKDKNKISNVLKGFMLKLGVKPDSKESNSQQAEPTSEPISKPLFE